MERRERRPVARQEDEARFRSLREAVAADRATWERERHEGIVPSGHVDALLREVDRWLGDGAGGGRPVRLAAALLGVLRQLDHQRRAPSVLPTVHLADRVAAEAVACVFPGDAVGRILPPLAWTWPGPVPKTWVHDVHRVPSGLAGDLAVSLPFGLVAVPPDHLRRPWRLASVLHEVGHSVDRPLGLAAQLADGFRAACPGARRWQDWACELAADLVAARVGGMLAVQALDWIVQGLAGGERVVRDETATYPPTLVRLAFGEVIATGRPGRYHELASVARPDLTRELDRALARADLRAIGASWPSPPADGAVAVLSQLLCSGPEAVDGAPPGEPEDADHAPGLLDALRRIPPPAGAAPGAVLAFLAGAVRRRAPGPAEATGRLHKTLPDDPLVRSDELAFVGATHRSLLQHLRAARARRGEPWHLLEIYFVAGDDQLEALYARPGEHDALVAARRAARENLEVWLASGAVADSWRVAGPAPGELCASFFAGRRPDGSPWWHVHTSASVWGVGIEDSPSSDFTHVGSDPHTHLEIDVLLRGLAHLRATAGGAYAGAPSPDALLVATAAANSAQPPRPG